MITIVIVHHRGRVLPTSKMIMIVIVHRGHVLSRHVDQEDEEKGEDGVAGGENQSRKKLHFFWFGILQGNKGCYIYRHAHFPLNP